MPEGSELIYIDENPSIMRARITEDECNTPIRRIFPLWLLQRVLRLKQLALAPPGKWGDPHEDPAALCVLKPSPEVRAMGREYPQPVSAFLAPAWAQCWSFNPGSDTLLRAYSRVIIDPLERRNIDPRNEGVSVTTTPRLLLTAMKKWVVANPNSHFVLGRVRYLSDEEIGQRLADTLNSSVGPQFFRTIQGRAESLLLKRSYFLHEEEVRLICLERNKVAGPKEFRPFAIDPNELFTEISFDPRLVSFERIERESEIRRLGYKGIVKEDRSYSRVINQIMMRRNWPDP